MELKYDRSCLKPGPKQKVSILRKLGVALPLLTASLFPACARNVPISAPPVEPPESVQVVQERVIPRDWAEAAYISKAEQFRIWEPILQEMTGIEPVPAHKVRFVPPELLKRECTSHSGACYIPATQNILINETTPEGRSISKMNDSFCRRFAIRRIKQNSRLSFWVHEQGHHADRRVGRVGRREEWIDEVEAVLLVFYFGEHVAKNYDASLGLSFVENMISNLDYQRRRAPEGDFASLFFNGEVTGLILGRLSIFALLSTERFVSFEQLWRFVHEHPHEEVEQLIIENFNNLENGEERAVVLFRNLYEQTGIFDIEFDSSVFRDFRITDGPELVSEFQYSRATPISGVDGFHWRNGMYGVGFSHFDGSDEGVNDWYLTIVEETCLLSIDIRRTPEGTELTLHGPNQADPVQALHIPNIDENLIEMSASAGPRWGLHEHINEEITVDADTSEYWQLTRGVFEEVRRALRESDDPEDGQKLILLEQQMRAIFGSL